MTSREIICADALPWLGSDCPPCAIVTSPAEQAEIGCTMEEWRDWYLRACELSFRALATGAPALIYSTDRKYNGGWVSKPYLMCVAAERAGVRLLWHKIVLRREPGACDVHRPGYTHLCAFGDADCRPGAVSPDVIRRGKMIYPQAMGADAAFFACAFAGREGLPIVDPFCGKGTVPAVANALGFDSIGVDILPEQCEAAQRCTIEGRLNV